MGKTDDDRARTARLEAKEKEESLLKRKIQGELSRLTEESTRLAEENERLQRSQEEMEGFRSELVDIKLELSEKLREAQTLAAAARDRSEKLNTISQDVRSCVNSLVILAKRLTATDGQAGSDDRRAYLQGINDSVDELKTLISELLETSETIALQGRHAETSPGAVEDDRDVIEPGDRVLLVVTGQKRLAQRLVDEGHERGFEVVVTSKRESAYSLAEELEPQAIVFDYGLSRAGEESILKRLRRDPVTRHIPVYVHTTHKLAIEAFQLGAKGILWKPADEKAIADVFEEMQDFVERTRKRVLVACEEADTRHAVIRAIDDDDVEIEQARTGDEALQFIQKKPFDCAVVDLNLPDMSGFGLVLRAGGPATTHVPFVVHNSKKYTPAQEAKLAELATKRIVRRSDTLLSLVDETSSILHRTEARTQRLRMRVIETAEADLSGAKVLMVDDDQRNLFAMSALLEEQGVHVRQAESGQKAIEMLEEEPRPDIVLMDIMMPEMDGFETMRRIRQNSGLVTMPIIALTAKALKGDREACIVAGASDYMSKPVDTERLLALMRAWLR